MIKNVLRTAKYLPLLVGIFILYNLANTYDYRIKEFSNEINHHPLINKDNVVQSATEESLIRKGVEWALPPEKYAHKKYQDMEDEEKKEENVEEEQFKSEYQKRLDKLLNVEKQSEETNNIHTEIKTKNNQDTSSQTGEKYSGYIDKISLLLNGVLTNVADVKSPTKDAVNVAEIIVNPKLKPKFDFIFENGTRKFFQKIVDKAHTKPLHWIVVTDEFSRYQAGMLIGSIIMKKLSMSVITNVYLHDLYLIPLYFTMVDYMQIKAKKPEFTNTYRHLNQTDEKGKYNHDFFFIAPLYHLAFTGLDRMIALDAQDLEFHIDIAELDDQFNEFKPSDILGIGNDLSPWYMLKLGDNYTKKHPDSIYGQPGRFQGFNTGVVLYNFKRMRESKIFNRYLEPKNMVWLLEKFEYNHMLAEQDWFTNLGWLHPSLFYLLPCTFNAQTSLELMRFDTKHYYDDYHFCDWFRNLKVVHYNGCGSQPIDCGHKDHNGDPDTHKSKKYKESAYIPPPRGVNWMYLHNMNPPTTTTRKTPPHQYKIFENK